MAMKPTNTSSAGGASFSKNLTEDVNGMLREQNSWTQARNASNNTISGDIGELSNESSNYLCSTAPYTIIGTIHIGGDEWAIFSTDNTDCEIGRFKEDSCEYTTIVNDQCLNFNTDNLIKGVGRSAFDCGKQLYWDDGVNPSRVLDIDDVPWIQDCTTDSSGCVFCEDTDRLDCEKIRLAPIVDALCFRVETGTTSGELLNGSYHVYGAYLVDGVKVGDYSLPSNVVGVFRHQNAANSIDVFVENADQNFDEFELYVVQFANFNTVARRLGVYSTRTNKITIDQLNERLPTVDPGVFLSLNRIPDRSDAIFKNGKYLIRTGPSDKFDFNYQPLANQIEAKWVSVEYPADYYRRGGYKTSYMRDEVYSFFIRWVYNTGDKSNSYHIPGRYINNTDSQPVINADLLPTDAGPERWRVYNTATVDPLFTGTGTVLPDGGVVLGGGDMAYWESEENYDDDKPQIWNASSDPIWGSTNAAHDLCGRKIRHHKFPDNATDDLTGNIITNHYAPNTDERIRIMGVEFRNIKPPLNNDGTPITNVVGYEILRGSREGNKSILAKGMINNMRQYLNQDEAGQDDLLPRERLYPNYPYNPTEYADQFIRRSQPQNSSSLNGNSLESEGLPPGQEAGAYGGEEQYLDSRDVQYNAIEFVKRDVFTFHSPETNFRDPYLSAKEIKIYGELNGTADCWFNYPEDHPRHKFITNTAFLVAGIIGIGYALLQTEGKKKVTNTTAKIDFGGTYAQAGVSTGATGLFGPSVGAAAAQIAAGAASDIANTTVQSTLENTLASTLLAAIGVNNADITDAAYKAASTAAASAGIGAGDQQFERELSAWAATPDILRYIQGVPSFLSFYGDGVNTTLDIILAFTPYKQFALQFFSHCLYDEFKPNVEGNIRRVINDSTYLEPNIQDFTKDYRINNIYRSRTVALKTAQVIDDTVTEDNTQRTFSQQFGRDNDERWRDENVSRHFNLTAASHYVALKQPLRSQYGQIANVNQVPVSTCDEPIGNTTSSILFGGDIYITRYTEKNTMFFFYEWLQGQPDGAPFDYTLHKMVTHPRFWMNTNPFDVSEFVSSFGNIFSAFGTPSAPGGFDPLANTEPDPSNPSFVSDCNCNNITVADCLYLNTGAADGGPIYDASDYDDYCDALQEYEDEQQYLEYMEAYYEFCQDLAEDPADAELPDTGPGGEFENCALCGDLPSNAANCSWSDNKWERKIRRQGRVVSRKLKKFNKEKDKLFEIWLEEVTGDDGGFFQDIADAIVTPNDRYAFDKRKAGTFQLKVKDAFMYLFNSGTRDFYVESEVNVDQRDWGDLDEQRHYDYDKWSDLERIYNTTNIKFGNYMKYDYSLSIAKLFTNYQSYGVVQSRDYDPLISETCYVYRPKRLIYSLPQVTENKADNWRVFLPNNYKDFSSKCFAIKPIGKNGAIMMFEKESPIQFAAVDQLQTDGGTKITIGDGGLFSQPLQNLVNAESPHEYGSCQNRLSVINTPAGIFYMSQNQGKIFQVGGGLKEISNIGMKWWFAKYLPYKLTEYFPDFELTDNPVTGIGCQAVFDNENQIAYFSKKDYALREDILDTVTYSGSSDEFLVNGRLKVKLGDPRYFKDASWTISFDPKTQGWISYHDWHPDLPLPSKKTFMTTKQDGIWVHNDTCESYCNFYGIDYPFEVEWAVHARNQVETLRSIEYYMEVYKYADNCDDRFHVLDFNFDEAVVYNSEQCSGLLKLNLMPKNNAPEILNYPAINPTNIDILYSKEEHKYRFNQFWDITDDRGEFNAAAERTILLTEPNGYVKELNPNNLNYDKFELERKKFRHIKHIVLLRRKVSGNRNMVISLGLLKKLISPR
jgi:hypothetical protein